MHCPHLSTIFCRFFVSYDRAATKWLDADNRAKINGSAPTAASALDIQ
jgi:hypothetical protein